MGIGETNPVPRLVVRFQGALREGRKGTPREDRGHGRVARRGDRRAAGVREVCFE